MRAGKTVEKDGLPSAGLVCFGVRKKYLNSVLEEVNVVHPDFRHAVESGQSGERERHGSDRPPEGDSLMKVSRA